MGLFGAQSTLISTPEGSQAPFVGQSLTLEFVGRTRLEQVEVWRPKGLCKSVRFCSQSYLSLIEYLYIIIRFRSMKFLLVSLSFFNPGAAFFIFIPVWIY